mmetsp:Transcript_80917/g.187935  ORF Transcript_80917/g.187935 Transcript_80917/m.187935 type:complete len:216 (-) Transcript_80917:469-1116(-)
MQLRACAWRAQRQAQARWGLRRSVRRAFEKLQARGRRDHNARLSLAVRLARERVGTKSVDPFAVRARARAGVRLGGARGCGAAQCPHGRGSGLQGGELPRLLAGLDRTNGAKVAVAAVPAVLAPTRLPEPGTWPACSHAVQCRAVAGQSGGRLEAWREHAAKILPAWRADFALALSSNDNGRRSRIGTKVQFCWRYVHLHTLARTDLHVHCLRQQ